MKNSARLPKLPPVPAGLSAEAASWWTRIVGEWEFDQAALLTLETALHCLDRWREAQALVNQHGIMVKDRFGQLKTNPAVLSERDAKGQLLAALKQLHLDLEPLNDGPGRPGKR